MSKTLTIGTLPQKQKGLFRILFGLPAGELNSHQLRKLAELSKRYGSGYVSLTMRQNFEIPNVPAASVESILKEMADAGFHPLDAQLSENVVACPGADQCGLALIKTLGLGLEISDHLKTKKERLPKRLTINLSGCSNGCTHPMINEIGLMGAGGKIADKKVFGFDVHIGGSHDEGRIGERIGFVPDGKVVILLDKILEIYDRECQKGETFTAFVARSSATQIRDWIEEDQDLLYPSITKERD